MNKYKSLITSSLVAIIIIATPAVTFADRNDKDNDNENGQRVKVEQKSELKTENSFFKNFNWKGDLEFRQEFLKKFREWSKERKEMSKKERKMERVENKDRDEDEDDDSKEYSPKNLAPKIEGITAPTVLKVNEVGTWKVKASDPNNGVLTYEVLFGDTNETAKSLSLSASKSFVQTGTFTHSYANKGTYKIKFTVSNEDGLKAISTVTVKVTDDTVVEKDTVAPVISKIGISTGTSNNATISWKTNEKTTGEIFYGTSKDIDVDNNNTLKVSDTNLKTDHVFSIPGLASSTLYHFILKSADASNNETLSSEITFVTN
jgi:hypothetical protein